MYKPVVRILCNCFDYISVPANDCPVYALVSTETYLIR